MKPSYLHQPLRVAALALLIAGAVTGLSAQESRLSTKPWLPLKKIETPEQFNALPPNAQIAMGCAKCKSVVVTTKRELTTKPGHGTAQEALTVDQCPGCGGTITVRPGKQTEMVHTCSKCGDDSAFCCSTTPNAKPTKGMEKK